MKDGFRPADGESTYLLLIRHGTTDANVQRPYILQGRSIDLSLNAQGAGQAAALGEFLAHYPIRAVHTSTLRRAIETAEAIARHHALDVSRHRALDEVDVGKWEGLDWGTIQSRYPEEHARFVAAPASVPYFGGESYEDVYRRSAPKLAELVALHRGEMVAVVAHNVVNRANLAPWLGLDLSAAKEIAQANTGINLIRFRGGEVKVVTLNAFFHLERYDV